MRWQFCPTLGSRVGGESEKVLKVSLRFGCLWMHPFRCRDEQRDSVDVEPPLCREEIYLGTVFFREEKASVALSVHVGKGYDSVVFPSGMRGVRVMFGV